MSNKSGPIFYTIQQKNVTSSTIPLSFDVTLSQPIFQKPSDWSVSVIRFRVPNFNTPLFTFIQNYYQLTMNYSTFSTSSYVSLNSGINPGEANIYELQTYVSMLNDTIKTLFAQMNLLTTLPTSDYPYFSYNEISQLLSFTANKNYFATDGSVATPIKFTINLPLLQQIQGFPLLNLPNSVDQLIVQSLNGTNLNGDYITMTSQQPFFQQLTDFDGLIFTSNMPVKNEYVGYNLSNSAITGSQISQIAYPILQDYSSGDITISNFHDSLTYNAIVPYRMTELISDTSFNNIHIDVFSTNTSGTFTRCELPPNGSANIKLMFTKKSENKFA